MGVILAVAFKDLRLLARDRMGLFWVLGFPLLIAVLFGAMFRGQNATAARPLAAAVVNEDGSALSEKYVALLKENSALELQTLSRAEALEALRKRALAAAIVVPKGFERNAGFAATEGVVFEIEIDPARQTEAAMLKGLVLEAHGRMLRARMADAKAFQDSIQAVDMALRFNETLPAEQRAVGSKFVDDLDGFLEKVDPKMYERALTRQSATVKVSGAGVGGGGIAANSFEITFPSGMIWGLIGCVATFSLSLVRERLSGTFLRLRAAPVSTGSVLAGKALACLLVCMATLTLLMAIGVIGFHVRLRDPIGLAAAVFCAAFCFTGLMMLISTLGTTEQSVAGAGWAILMVLAMFGGAMMPLYFMPEWMQNASAISPVKWAILALEGALWRGFGVNELAAPCVLLVGVGAVAFAGGVLLARRQNLAS